MANSTIIITFNSIPIDGEIINLADTSISTLLNEIFKINRTAAGQVTIPTATSYRYQIDYPSDAPTFNIGVRYRNLQGNLIEGSITSLFALSDDASGQTRIVVNSVLPPIIYNLTTGQAIQWEYGSFYEVSSTSGGSVVDNYKTAFDTDYNTANSYTVEAVNDTSGNTFGNVFITANYSNAVFVLNSNTTNATITINNEDSVPSFSFFPNSILFSFKQNEALPSKLIYMTGNGWKIIGKPNFVLASTTTGVAIDNVTDSNGDYQIIYGSGNAQVSIALGDYYNQDIDFQEVDLLGSFSVLKDNVDFGSIAYSIVISSINDFLINPYINQSKAFTLDHKYFEFRSSNIETYFQVDASIKTYDFFTNALKEYFIPLKIVLFNRYAKENFGQIIHRLMDRFAGVNDILSQYKQATLQLKCTEISLTNESVIRSGSTSEIPFIAGLSRGFNNLGFLDFNANENRVTTEGFAFLNIIVSAGNYELRTFKNGRLINAVALPNTSEFILCKKVLFSSYAQGDVVEFGIDLVGQYNNNTPRKKYIVFPKGNYSNMIVWENEFLLQSAIECTGTGSMVPEGEFISQTLYQNLVEQLEHLSTSKKVKLSINTGWLMYSDIDTVESLMRSKRAWLIQGDNQIALRPISKKLPQKSNDEELIQFQLEFQINQKYDEETYSL